MAQHDAGRAWCLGAWVPGCLSALAVRRDSGAVERSTLGSYACGRRRSSRQLCMHSDLVVQRHAGARTSRAIGAWRIPAATAAEQSRRAAAPSSLSGCD